MTPDSAQPALILYHYDFSPFAEKVRLMMGIKRLRWASVITPSVMPKPDLVAITGGYRHIPVLQIGADVYCDTRTIARELDRRFPEPMLLPPARRSVARAIEAWVERDLFWPIARFVSGVNAETVDPGLHVDRATLRGKPAPSIARLKSVARRNLGQVRAQLPIVDGLLTQAPPVLDADAPGVAEIAVYHTLWFLGVFEIDCSDELNPYPRIREWMTKMGRIGHGEMTEITAAQAQNVAKTSEPKPPGASISDDALPPLGSRIAVRPDDYATAAVEGELRWADPDDIALLRRDERLGNIMVHFPRVGYAIKTLE